MQPDVIGPGTEYDRGAIHGNIVFRAVARQRTERLCIACDSRELGLHGERLDAVPFRPAVNRLHVVVKFDVLVNLACKSVLGGFSYVNTR